MALLRSQGKLLAGALFAGLLFGPQVEFVAPEVPQAQNTGGGGWKYSPRPTSWQAVTKTEKTIAPSEDDDIQDIAAIMMVIRDLYG